MAVANWRYLGVDRDANAIVWESLGQVSAESVAGLVSEAARGPAFITIVGDTSRIDLDGLAALGRVELHEAEDLFPFGSFD